MRIEKPVIIEEDVMLEGRMYSPYPTQIKGYVVGEIVSKESVTINKYGEVRGNIKTKNAVIEGKFVGNLILSGNLEITATGRLIGNVITKNLNLVVELGGVFKGSRFIVENEEIFVINKDEIIADINIKAKEIL